MKILFVFLSLLILSSFICVAGQSTSSKTTPIPQRTPTLQENEKIERDERNRVTEKELNRMTPPPSISTYVRRKPTDFIEQMYYRHLTKKELKLLAPDRSDLEKYANFLTQPNTGLIRLMADKGCVDNLNIVVANETCLIYSMPGAGSSYSFRFKDYRIERLADLTFSDNKFKAPGVLTQGILAGIGDIPLDEVNLQTKGLKFLLDFQPTTDYEKAKEVTNQLFGEGILNEGIVYRRNLDAVENMTYVLRSIAYQGYSSRAYFAVVFNELDFDKREDVIIAFRIISKSADGSVAILWKELARKQAPKFKK